MKYLLVIAAFFLFLTKMSAQQILYPDANDSTIIKMQDYYDGYGKIYNRTSRNVLPSCAASVFAPTGQELLSAERLMIKGYEGLLKSDDRLKSLRGTKYKEHYYKYYRQYVGFIDTSGEKVIFIQLIKCCNGKLKKCFPEWKMGIVSNLSEDLCRITMNFLVNLSQGKIFFP
jgi:hypothetical protein